MSEKYFVKAIEYFFRVHRNLLVVGELRLGFGGITSWNFPNVYILISIQLYNAMSMMANPV